MRGSESLRMNPTHTQPEVATGNILATASPITDKKGYARRWSFSVRKVDNLLASGMPHMKIGKRRVRIETEEADAWMKNQFRVQHRVARGWQVREIRRETGSLP